MVPVHESHGRISRRRVSHGRVSYGRASRRRASHGRVLRAIIAALVPVETLCACSGRSLAITKSRLMGLVPKNAQPGDLVYVLLSGQVLHLLRPVEQHFVFVGECYIHGMMDGEALDMLKNGSRKLETIEIR